MATINLVITRSEQWVTDQRIARGENVPRELVCPVEIKALSEETRKILLQFGGGEYRTESNECRLRFDIDFEPNRFAGYGTCAILIDSDSPTPAEIDAAVAVAVAELRDKRTRDRLQKATKAAERAEAARKKEEQAAALQAARELLADELAEVAQLKADREILSQFLSDVPLDALRRTIRARCSGEEVTAKVMETIEAASPYWIFKRDDEE